jgi:hypothetical protein
MIRTCRLLSVMFLFLSGTAGAVPAARWAEPADNTAGMWSEVTSMPERPSIAGVSDGGGLAVMPASGLIYTIKGNRTGDFYSYSPGTGAWLTLAMVPDGPDLKQVKTGAGIATDRTFNVYVVKGNNTSEFYRYSVDTLAWRRIQDVPRGASGKKVKGGDMVGVQLPGATHCYFLKGITNEFYRYSTADTVWHQLSMPQIQAHAKWDKGSFLVYDGDHTVYAHKAKYNELWTYNTGTDSWCKTPLLGIPFVGRSGRSKKSKDGACGVFYNNCIYALKGGNTQEFWRYDTATRVWTEMETLPQYGSSGKRKLVKGGGDMVLANSAFYALKGSKTREVWKYTPADFRLPPAGHQSAAAGAAFDARRLLFAITPNPLVSDFATVRLSSLPAAPSSLRIYNTAGCLVHSLFGIHTSSFRLDLRSLPGGVYLVRLATEGFDNSQKLLIQR